MVQDLTGSPCGERQHKCLIQRYALLIEANIKKPTVDSSPLFNDIIMRANLLFQLLRKRRGIINTALRGIEPDFVILKRFIGVSGIAPGEIATLRNFIGWPEQIVGIIFVEFLRRERLDRFPELKNVLCLHLLLKYLSRR